MLQLIISHIVVVFFLNYTNIILALRLKLKYSFDIHVIEDKVTLILSIHFSYD